MSISLKETGPKPEEFSIQHQKLDVSFGISYQYTKLRYIKGSFTPWNQNVRMVEVGGDLWRSSGPAVLQGHLEQDGDSTKFLMFRENLLCFSLCQLHLSWHWPSLKRALVCCLCTFPILTLMSFSLRLLQAEQSQLQSLHNPYGALLISF